MDNEGTPANNAPPKDYSFLFSDSNSSSIPSQVMARIRFLREDFPNMTPKERLTKVADKEWPVYRLEER
jgi:hypothetical protein